MVMSGKWAFDMEANGFLDDTHVDYTMSPWKLKDSFKIHCIVAINEGTGKVVHFVQDECNNFKQWVVDNVD